MRLIIILILLVAAATSVCGQYTQPAAPSQTLTIQYIANEGILITDGSKSILIDAIHRSYQPDYEFTPEEILSKIESGLFPYNNINLVLISHNHLDHFHPESIARHLINNPNAKLVSSSQVIEEVTAAKKLLETDKTPSKPNSGQLRQITYKWKKSESIEIDGIKVKFLGLRHANSKIEKFRSIQNFGHLIEIGGKKLLHIGDADMFAENFSAFELNKEKIDVAFVPYWFVLSKEGREILKNHLNARTTVAIHVPPHGKSKTIRDILEAMPSAVVFSQSGEMLNY